ncbi:imidazole glycerol-phosphate dehydratase/histidinol phosphatase [Legionella birminghamensis]|uniref:Imidazoleglycerol-phosphate dehydratase n=1 Tax=Legionella birminghamensis TaxID=28083 RepID=A0A378IA58_9GAMM|nr:bifunctional histidinol-phosphatase/imidazoleglycerol-phosphate dehydratase HisB [Legionella birminghamensis]KTC75610.1 imidazole glycerol-phosphate dehydratase/histidinol phosphatase [Legionella birminghamensis]STX31933.1 histidinol-phosphatase [Legionella birminghamensis]
MNQLILIDRDGTLIEEPEDFQIDRLEKIKLLPEVIPSLLRLKKAGYQFLMVTNQDGLGTDSFPFADFERCQNFILNLFASQGIVFREILICPHRPDENCPCRKPDTGLLDGFLKENTLDSKTCWMLGDRLSDQEFASNLGIPFLAVNQQQNWSRIADRILARKAAINRQTRETSIQIELNLDLEEQIEISTPIPFFSHMLEQIAKHGGFSMQLRAMGDTEVDEHHLIEDTALALGAVLRESLADKRGIGRYGFTLPMDESLASIAIDLAGRAYCRFEASFTREFVGGMATEMVAHFFHSLASSLGASIHIKVTGENHHHMIEACFKSLGRALRQACARIDNDLPSTKGLL